MAGELGERLLVLAQRVGHVQALLHLQVGLPNKYYSIMTAMRLHSYPFFLFLLNKIEANEHKNYFFKFFEL